MTPTEQIASPASTPKTGLFAMLRALLRAQVTGAPSRALLAAPLITLPALALSVTALLALSAGVAQAEPPKLVSYGNFGSVAPFSIGVAVDQPSGDVYVAGLVNLAPLGPSNLDKFDAAGRLLSPPSPFGEGYNSGAAVNPTNGDVYVLGKASFSQPLAIDTYDPCSGALLGSFSVPASGNLNGFFTVVQIATDSAGNVYLPVVPENKVLEYNPSECPALPEPCALKPVKTFTGGSGAGALSGPTGVAVDSSGNVWVADAHNNRIEELGSTGTFVGEIKSEGVGAVALDTHGVVFAMVNNSADSCGSIAPPCYHLVEYSSAGAQLADIGAGSFGEAKESPNTVPSMLAVNDSSGRVYVTDGTKNLIWVFGPPSAPVIGRELAAEVGDSEAKLGALVNPGGLETSYRFEYLAEAAFHANGDSFSGPNAPSSVPFPEGNVGQGVTSRTVWAAASGLAPGTTYRYRAIATNALGSVVGADQAFTTETGAQTSCPNEQFRGGFSAGLPDCRAYELVTPPTKTSTQPGKIIAGLLRLEGSFAARDGNRFAYTSIDVQPGAPSGGENDVAVRGASGWSSEDVIPLQSYTGDRCSIFDAKASAYSADLSHAVVFVGGMDTGTPPPSEDFEGAGREDLAGGCGAEGLEVVRGEPLGVENLLLRDSSSGAYQLINLTPPGVTPADAVFADASPDLSHVVFHEMAPLAANAPAGVNDLYEWADGVVRLVTVLPNGVPAAGSLPARATAYPETHAVSADGSRVFFTAAGKLYVRKNAERAPAEECADPSKACTVQLDASQVGGSGGGGKFLDASADGSQAFFTDDASAALTSDTVPGSGPNLYRFDLSNGTLTDLTAHSGAEVQELASISEDGSYVYFFAKGVLAGNTREFKNSEGNTVVEGAQNGQQNLYLWHGGTTTFVAAFATEVLRRSPNGAFLAFATTQSLTGYDNTQPDGFPAPEIFLYSATANQLVCASCNPSGEPPTTAGGASLESRPANYLSDSGRLFFDTADALVPSDTNGQADVYEYQSGQLHLISTGTSASESRFLDASESGNDVFFLTRQKLVPQDTEEEARTIYDARVDGGIPSTSTPPPCTTADACRTAPSPQPSIFGAPSSATFSGAGNLTPPPLAVKTAVKSKKCKKGFTKKKGKCVKTKKSKRARKANPKGRH